MTITQLLIWLKVIPTLISANILTAAQVGPLLKSCHPSLTDDEVTGVTQLVTQGEPK